MLKKIELWCFRRHEHLVVDFTNGLNVVRAANEGGKSTMLEGVGYALYGAKVLRDSLDECVTWGCATKDLKVRLDVEAGGKVYTFTRSKGGAEVVVDGQVFVTGQNEVSAFAAQLLGADAQTATYLMLSNQMGLRGVLTNGPKATAQLIEELGDFDLFDRLLDAAQLKLSLGSPAMVESRIESLQRSLDNLGTPVAPDEAAMLAALEQIGGLQTQFSESLVRLQADLDTADGRLRAAEMIRNRHAELTRTLTRTKNQIASAETDLSNLDLTGEIVDTTALEKAVADEEAFAERLAAYTKFQKLPVVENHLIRSAFDAATRMRQGTLKTIRERGHDLAVIVSTAQAKIQTGSCTFCGQDISSWPAVAERNAALEAEIAAAKLETAQLELDKKAIDEAQAAADAVTELENQVLRGVRGIERWLERNESVIPAEFTWKGEVPADGDLPDSTALLRQVRARNTALTKARAQAEVLNVSLKKLRDEQVELSDALNELAPVTDVEFDTLAQALAAVRERISTTKEQLRDLERQSETVQRDFERARDEYARAVELRAQFEAQITQAKDEIAQLERNNVLVKKIRAARPTIGNKLWALVLSTVSSIFSSMRGETSVVAKGKDGFTVNGKGVTSLSGSTLDLLGLAIRVALIKTFIPHCPLLVLDEPTSSCDDDRTVAMLAYIVSSGFQQTILVTHENISESMASNLIQI